MAQQIKKRGLSDTPISEIFLKACEGKDLEKVKACLTLEVDINCLDSDNHSALFKSLTWPSRDERIADLLLGHPDLDVDQVNKEKILLFVAQDLPRLRKLCQLPGIDVNAGNPLDLAIILHNVAAINILAENPALDWNAGYYLSGSPIETALRWGYADIVEILLSKPTLNLVRTGFGGRSVGHWAVEYSYLKEGQPGQLNVSAFPVKCVELLSKDPRVNWNVRNRDGETPIMVALKNKEKEMVKILLRNPRVDRGDIMKTNEGNEILTEMLQGTDEESIAKEILTDMLLEADEKNRKLPSKVPECPVSISYFFFLDLYLLMKYLSLGLLRAVLSRVSCLPLLRRTLCLRRL